MPVDPRAFAGIGLMGGPMSVNDELAWNAPMRALLRAAVDRGIPVLGHCLGGQLLAQALGAPVTRAPVAEIGWVDVEVCDVSAQRDWFGGRAAFTTFQWHYDAFALPADATLVLTNAFNANQAFVVAGRHIGFQCHIEMTRLLVDTWLATGAHELPAQSTRAAQSAVDIRRDLDARAGRAPCPRRRCLRALGARAAAVGSLRAAASGRRVVSPQAAADRSGRSRRGARYSRNATTPMLSRFQPMPLRNAAR